MTGLRQTLEEHAKTTAKRIALRGQDIHCTYAELNAAVKQVSQLLVTENVRVLGLLADNGITWVVSDLAALFGGIVMVPLPLFFSPHQMCHAIRDSGMDALLTDQPWQTLEQLQKANICASYATEWRGLHLIKLTDLTKKNLPAGTAKITYTSGTTGAAKGVCLSCDQMETVAQSLQTLCHANTEDQHLCLTPLSTLLENIAGVYVPLLAGGCVNVLPLQRVGLRGATGIDVARMWKALSITGATTTIMAPQMLQELVNIVIAGMASPPALRFVAVGGAPVSSQLLERAHMLDIPVYEGYGLSECSSVVALNVPGHNKYGTVGRPLPHITLSFAADHEILVNGSAFLGYLGQSEAAQPWHTGDLGYLDEDGYLHLIGRKKSLFITSFGRNVAPEWVECELTMHPAIAQAALFGESSPFNVAVIVAAQNASREQIDEAIELTNSNLPDYARVSRWILAHAPFTPENEQLTSNGRLKRENIKAEHDDLIKLAAQEETYDIL